MHWCLGLTPGSTRRDHFWRGSRVPGSTPTLMGSMQTKLPTHCPAIPHPSLLLFKKWPDNSSVWITVHYQDKKKAVLPFKILSLVLLLHRSVYNCLPRVCFWLDLYSLWYCFEYRSIILHLTGLFCGVPVCVCFLLLFILEWRRVPGNSMKGLWRSSTFWPSQTKTSSSVICRTLWGN